MAKVISKMADPTPTLDNKRNRAALLFLKEYQRRIDNASSSASVTESDVNIANLSDTLQEAESVTANLSHFVSTMGITSSKSAPYVWTQQWQKRSPFDEKIVRDVVMDPAAEFALPLSQSSSILASEQLKRGATDKILNRDFSKHGFCEIRSIFLCSEAAKNHDDFETAKYGYHKATQLSPYVSTFHHRYGMLAWNRGDFQTAKTYFEAACATKSYNWLVGDAHKAKPILLSPIPDRAKFLYFQSKLYLVPSDLNYIASFIFEDRMYVILNSFILRLWIDFKIPELLGLFRRSSGKTKTSTKKHVEISYVPIVSSFRYKVLKTIFQIKVLENLSILSNRDDVQDLLECVNKK